MYVYITRGLDLLLFSEYKSDMRMKTFRWLALAQQKADGLSEKQMGYFSLYFIRIRRAERQNLTEGIN